MHEYVNKYSCLFKDRFGFHVFTKTAFFGSLPQGIIMPLDHFSYGDNRKTALPNSGPWGCLL